MHLGESGCVVDLPGKPLSLAQVGERAFELAEAKTKDYSELIMAGDNHRNGPCCSPKRIMSS